MFADTAVISIAAGNGGDGAVSFRHERYIDKGGPDGGDGGRGGNVIMKATTGLNTLTKFRYKQELKAESGERGGKRRMHGKSGEDKIIEVPIGTIVRNGDIVVADFTEDKQEVIIAKGGDGGFGNAHFKSSVRQTPRVAELGEKGERFDLNMELKLLADVGLVGYPNAGKSTFLSVVSNARPEIADYAFTTLTPNLGIATIDDQNLLIADIPGLIEGASEGKGLGVSFLRHIERTSVILHLVDIYRDDVAAAYKAIRTELESYGHELAKRREVVALTKVEGFDEDIIQSKLDELRAVVPENVTVLAVSSISRTGVEGLLRDLLALVAEDRAAQLAASQVEDEDDGQVVISLTEDAKDAHWEIREQEGIFIVSGDKIERFARRTDYNNVFGVNRLRDIMRRYGITREIERKGGGQGSTVSIASHEFTLYEE